LRFPEKFSRQKKRDGDPAELPFHPGPGPKQKKLLLFFPLLCRFSLDIDETQFYTFINCNLRIAESMQPIERENRQNGNQESSQEGTREEGRQEGREKGREEKVADRPTKGNAEGALKSAPSTCLGAGLDF
jgi:hypothetical protein